jgi:hypothetical protein
MLITAISVVFLGSFTVVAALGHLLLLNALMSKSRASVSADAFAPAIPAH